MQMLIVDDDREIVQLIPLLLPEYTFRKATSGKDALEWMRQAPTDLVLLGLMMPEMGGLEVLQTMKAHAAMATIPVIIVSAKYQEEEIQEGLQAGADGYLVKPFETQDLRQAIKNLLREKGAERER